MMEMRRCATKRESWLLYFASSALIGALWQWVFLCFGLGFELCIDVLKERGVQALRGDYRALRRFLEFPLLCVLSAWVVRNSMRSANTLVRQIFSGCTYLLLPIVLMILISFLEINNWQIDQFIAFPLSPLYVVHFVSVNTLLFLGDEISAKLFLFGLAPACIWLQVLALHKFVPRKKDRVPTSQERAPSLPMKIWIRLKPLAWICLIVIGIWFALDRLSSGTRHEDMLEVEAYLLENQETIHEFHKIFPAAKHGISYFTGEYGHPAWYSEYEWPDGWQITLRFPLVIDRSNNTARTQETRLLIIETPMGPHPQWELGPQYHVPDAVWRSFVDSKGDRSLLGIPIN